MEALKNSGLEVNGNLVKKIITNNPDVIDNDAEQRKYSCS
jgi:hypothetical protein